MGTVKSEGNHIQEIRIKILNSAKELLAEEGYRKTTIRKIVDYAEEVHVGLVCSLLWHDAAIPTHVGEKRSAMGNPDSRTVKYAKDYVTAVVREFVDSPAVWAWEIGNEYNLDADLCDPEFKTWLPAGFGIEEGADGFDYYTSGEMRVFLEEVAKAIRAVDPDRMISSGHSEMRAYSKALYNAGLKADPKTHSWTVAFDTDSDEDFVYMNSMADSVLMIPKHCFQKQSRYSKIRSQYS